MKKLIEYKTGNRPLFYLKFNSSANSAVFDCLHKEAVVKKAEELQAQGMISVIDKVMALLYYDSVS